MRRILATALACVLLLGSCAIAGDAGVFSYDFDLRFRLNANLFSFRQREHMQGYADLLDLLEFRGNLSWNQETECSDLYLEIIPQSNPSSAVSVRIWGIPTMHRVTSPLLGDKAACFNPGAFPHFAVSARDVFQVPLPYLALMNPQTTATAFRSLAEIWEDRAGRITKNGSISYNKVKEIAEDWTAQLEMTSKISDWIQALTDPSYDDGLARQDLNTLPQQLLDAADRKPLTVTNENGTTRIRNAAGIVLWERMESESEVSCILNVPEEAARYIPSFSARKETAGGVVSFTLNAGWNCAEETARTDPETGAAAKRLDLCVEAKGLPAALPAETAFSGLFSQKGTILPVFSFLMNGSTKENGTVRIALTFADNPDAGEFFSCEGTVTPATHEEPMDYTWGGLETDYNILNLSYSAQGEMIDAIKRPFVLGMIDFLYELPASSCQSVMDDLEDSGILRTVLQ